MDIRGAFVAHSLSSCIYIAILYLLLSVNETTVSDCLLDLETLFKPEVGGY